MAPMWTHDEFGQLVPRPIEGENEGRASRNDSLTKKETLPSIPRGGALQRVPLKAKDPNVKFGSDEYEKPVEDQPWFNHPGLVQGAVLAACAKRSETTPIQFERKGKPEIQPAFRVFDETGSATSGLSKGSIHSKPPQSRPSSGRVDGLIPLTSNLRVDDEERTPAEAPSPADSDAEILLLMLERLTTVLEVSQQQEFTYSTSQVKPASHGAPTKWITRYVDYTSKYGLGFLMNDGR